MRESGARVDERFKKPPAGAAAPGLPRVPRGTPGLPRAPWGSLGRPEVREGIRNKCCARNIFRYLGPNLGALGTMP